MIKKLGGVKWTKLKVEFDRWRASKSIFTKEEWDAADEYHGYQWWHSFGDSFEHLNVLAMKILSKPIAASACEFNWSDVSQVISKRTTQRTDKNIERMVNVRAMYRLEQTVVEKVVLLGNIPKLDDILDEFINNEIEERGVSGDDVADPEEQGGDHDSDDDEDLEISNDDIEEELYELGGNRNDHLDAMVGMHLA